MLWSWFLLLSTLPFTSTAFQAFLLTLRDLRQNTKKGYNNRQLPVAAMFQSSCLRFYTRSFSSSTVFNLKVRDPFSYPFSLSCPFQTCLSHLFLFLYALFPCFHHLLPFLALPFPSFPSFFFFLSLLLHSFTLLLCCPFPSPSFFIFLPFPFFLALAHPVHPSRSDQLLSLVRFIRILCL